MTPIVLIHGLFGHFKLPEVHDAFAPVETSAPALIGYGEHREADTPDWASRRCTARINIPRTGHLMMVESSEGFAEAVTACVTYRPSCSR